MAFLERPLMFPSLTTELLVPEPLDKKEPLAGDVYDPEMLYVECQMCGRPILWDKGRTTLLLSSSGVDMRYLDARCMILSDGCATCSPEKEDGYTLSVVRVAGLTPEEVEYMTRPCGTA